MVNFTAQISNDPETMNRTKNRSRMCWLLLATACLLSFNTAPLQAKEKKKKTESTTSEGIPQSSLEGLKWRGIGPAMTSGRIADFAVNPADHSEWYVAVASGNVWKTTNNGTTFKPVFDNYGSYSTGVITMDPNNSNVLWLGTGENNHQRALGYGDGVYKSEDGGDSWTNMGLKDSRHIGGIVVDPRNSKVVFVAAEGSAWGPGGDRGLYKTIDGGVTWNKVLEVSEQTGINNVIMDPEDPDVMYATSEQRRRHVFTKIGGGPESTVYRSTDGGESWEKANKGLPGVHIGGMGIAVSPVDRNVLYLIVEAAEGKGGFYRSTNRAASWERMGDYASSGQYYNEIFCDPVDVNKVYSVETVSKVTVDAGRTWTNLGLDNRHVDDHALWIDPEDPRHFLIGGDGGVYESFDGGKTYLYKSNLPVTQFYRVFADNSKPFYNVYGGTQDNNTLGGPSMNKSTAGVTSEEWEALLGGDGFWAASDPENPDIVYAESQYGNVTRIDRRSGEKISIKPRPRQGEETYKWNWNAPLVISHHSNTRLYIMANKVFRSDNRGNTWEVISEDLTSGTDRNTWPVMDHYWSWDAVVKDVSTSLWGTGVSFAESRLDEKLLYAGTDDGVISVTRDGGANWTRIRTFPGIPEYTYISDLLPDRFEAGVVYATFDNRKRDDFTPYVLKSEDQGATWTSIAGNLPENGTVHTIEQDPEVPGLLFAGTEFGCYFTVDGGAAWTKLGAGLPTISVRDMALQESENDLVLATFGRGFYILDDYTPLRELAKDQSMLEKDAHIFPVADARMYIQTGGKYGQGSTFYKSKNPDYGATFTYFVKEVPKTLKAERKEREKALFEDKQPIPQPTRDELRAEEAEKAPELIFTIYDSQGHAIRKLHKKASKGIHRITWDLRYPSTRAIGTGGGSGSGHLAMPGEYSVGMHLLSRGELTTLSDPVPFTARMLDDVILPATDYSRVVAFQQEVTELTRVYAGAERVLEEEKKRLQAVRKALAQTPAAGPGLAGQVEVLERELEELAFIMEGPGARASWEELPPMDMPLDRRLRTLIYGHYRSTGDITQTEADQLAILKEEFPPVLERIQQAMDDMEELNRELDAAKAPWTPGRVPRLD
jgi:photosystem II stability/assembly factor-like uncharacterized protein